MKISELAQIDNVRKEIRLPLAFQGENRYITLGQIVGSIPASVVPFTEIIEPVGNVTIVPGSEAVTGGKVIYDSQTNRFYCSKVMLGNNGEVVTVTTLYYQKWDAYDEYYDAQDNIRQDCLFRASNGDLYAFNGTELKMSGVGKPIEMADEDAMDALISANGAVDGQIYFIAED